MMIETFFDRAKLLRRLHGPTILYHYTTWEAAENILRSQRFWATAHDCTNDDGELTSADATILEAVRAAEADSSGLARRLLRLFIKTYDHTRIGAARRTYLVCFSQARDDPHQWYRYGARGAGVCLGLRLFRIPAPNVPGVTTSFMPVDYRESRWREKIHQWLCEFVRLLERAEDIERNWRLAMDTLNVVAAAWALTSKRPRWEPENEVRAIFLVREGAKANSVECLRPDGTRKRYLEVPLTRLRRMPVEEVIIGTKQGSSEGRRRATEALTAAGYRNPESKLVLSAVSASDCDEPSHYLLAEGIASSAPMADL